MCTQVELSLNSQEESQGSDCDRDQHPAGFVHEVDSLSSVLCSAPGSCEDAWMRAARQGTSDVIPASEQFTDTVSGDSMEGGFDQIDIYLNVIFKEGTQS